MTIKTLTETFWSGSNDSTFIAASGSLSKEQKLLENDEIAESLTFKLLKEKIDELVKKVNELSEDDVDEAMHKDDKDKKKKMKEEDSEEVDESSEEVDEASNDEVEESLTFKLLKEKIDELVKKVNELS